MSQVKNVFKVFLLGSPQAKIFLSFFFPFRPTKVEKNVFFFAFNSPGGTILRLFMFETHIVSDQRK